MTIVRLFPVLALALALPLAIAHPLSEHRPRDDYAAESTFHPASEEAKVYAVGSDM